MIDLDELAKLREYLEDETVRHLIESERDRLAFDDLGCRCVLCVSRYGLLAMVQQVRRSVKAHATVAKLYGKATAERDAALADLDDAFKVDIDKVHNERDAALARITEAAKLHRVEVSKNGYSWCIGCSTDEYAEDWPCPTAKALGLSEGREA